MIHIQTETYQWTSGLALFSAISWRLETSLRRWHDKRRHLNTFKPPGLPSTKGKQPTALAKLTHVFWTITADQASGMNFNDRAQRDILQRIIRSQHWTFTFSLIRRGLTFRVPQSAFDHSTSTVTDDTAGKQKAVTVLKIFSALRADRSALCASIHCLRQWPYSGVVPPFQKTTSYATARCLCLATLLATQFMISSVMLGSSQQMLLELHQASHSGHL